ncbi:MAG: InlB B-repeat-containing protein, partial [Clostridia bacterium]|nr:InlB B-repeat-containing protein [Clostridia bacterium]
DGDVIAIRSGNVLLSCIDGKKIAVEENEDGEIVAPFKMVQWRVTKNEDGTYVFTSYATGEQLAVFTDDEGNFVIGTVVDSDESNPGGSELPEASKSETDLEKSTETKETETEVKTEPEAETETEPAAIGTDWTIESAGGHIYLKTTVSGQTLYLTLSGEDEWTAGASGSTVSFWKTTEEPVIPDEPDVPDDPEDPEDPESGRGPLSKEELDKNRPTTNPEDFMAAESLNPGDIFILYHKKSFDSDGKYRLLNGSVWGYNLSNVNEYNAETSAVRREDVPENCIWTLEIDPDGCPNCSKPTYLLKNVKTGQYFVYGTVGNYNDSFFTSNLEDSSIVLKSVHLEYKEEKTEDGITRTVADFYFHDYNGMVFRKYYLCINGSDEALVVGINHNNNFYVSRIGEEKEYYAVQYIVDGKLFDLQYVFEGKTINHPALPQKEGYSYCWAVEGDTVTVNEDLIFESISSKDVITLYMTYLLYHDNTFGVGEYNMNLYWDTDLFHKDAIKDFYLRKTSEIATFFNGYNETSISGNNQALVIGEFGYLRDYTNESHKQMIENKYKSKIIDVYGEEAFNNLMLHTISMNGEIIGIGFFGGYFICDDNSEDKDYSARYQVYNFETVVGEQNPTVYLSKDVVHYYYRYPKGFCGWDLNCGYDDLFSFENFESHTVVFKDLDGNVIYQEEVPYYGKVQIIPDVPQKEGYEGAWFATQALYTGIFEDKVIYPIYYEVMAEHGTLAGISNDGPNRAFFDNDYSTALYEDFFGGFSHNGIMSASSNYSSGLDYKEYGNTITLGYIGLVSELAIYTENNNGFINIDQYKKENYRSNFNSKHYSNYSKDHTAEDEIELPVFALIDEETGELFEIVIGYAAFAMSNENDVAEYPVVGIFDPQLYGSACIYTTRPADKPVSLYGPYAMSYLRPLWHFSEGTESFSLDVFSGLKNIEVTYVDENGEGIYTEILAIGGSVENVPAVPAKEGYTGAWDHTGTGIVGKTVISPVYTQITYTVTIHLGEGKSYELEVVYGEDVGLPATPPEKEGYIGSWDHDGNNITEDTVINAVYEKQPFTVTFMIDGETVATQTVATGENASLPGIPEKSGYNGVWDHDGKNITADTVITAVYTQKTYEVTFVANGNTVNIQEIEHGKDAILPAVPEKEGHTGQWSGDYTNVTSDRTIRAVYTAKKYTVRYYDEDDNLVSKQTVAYGQNTDEPDVPESKNNPGAGGRWDHDGKNITGNTYIYPDYTYETHRVRYYVDGKLYNTQYVNNTQDAIPPAVPAKEGYNGKWDKDGKNITKDTKINAVYTPKTYRVIFIVDGEEIADVGVKYG